MALALVLLVLYCLPITLGILLTSWILKKTRYRKFAKRFRKIAFIILGIGFLATNFYFWWGTHHFHTFDLNSKYEIRLKVTEIDSFQDQTTDFKMTIKNKENREKQVFKFHTIESAQLKFLTSENQPDIILIKGYDYNAGVRFWIDLNKKTMDHDYEYDNSIKADSGFVVVATLSTPSQLVIK